MQGDGEKQDLSLCRANVTSAVLKAAFYYFTLSLNTLSFLVSC